MRNISKSTEPRQLTESREAGTTFNGLPGGTKSLIRRQLIAEQKGLCCYCCQRIRDDSLRTKVEHWKPQTKYPNLALSWENLLASCSGGSGLPPEQQHCDTFKRDAELSQNPADPQNRLEETMRYLSDGTVRSSNPAFDSEIGNPEDLANGAGVLNLNAARLKNVRKAALDGFRGGLGKRALKRAFFERRLSDYDGSKSTELRPFAPVIAYWLKKKIRQV